MTVVERDNRRTDVVRCSLPGHDQECALAMLSQARHRYPIDDIQVAHLLAIGYRRGASDVELLTADLRAAVAEAQTNPGRRVRIPGGYVRCVRPRWWHRMAWWRS